MNIKYMSSPANLHAVPEEPVPSPRVTRSNSSGCVPCQQPASVPAVQNCSRTRADVLRCCGRPRSIRHGEVPITTLPAGSKSPPYVWGTGTGSASPTDQGCVGSRADCQSALNRKRGPAVRQFHWSERNLNRRRVYRKKVLGSVGRYADQAAARCAVTVFLAEINSEKVRITI
jgi:hypothetical protein